MMTAAESKQFEDKTGRSVVYLSVRKDGFEFESFDTIDAPHSMPAGSMVKNQSGLIEIHMRSSVFRNDYRRCS